MTYQTHTQTHTYLKQMHLKEAYLSSTFFSSRYLTKSQGFCRVESADISTTPKGFGGFMSVVWMWLRLCVYVVTGHGEPLEVDTQRAMGVRRPNRARRHLNHHFTKPSVRGGAKPARNLAPFCAFGPRRVSPTQFMERLCRLSLWGESVSINFSITRIVKCARPYGLCSRAGSSASRAVCVKLIFGRARFKIRRQLKPHSRPKTALADHSPLREYQLTQFT